MHEYLRDRAYKKRIMREDEHNYYPRRKTREIEHSNYDMRNPYGSRGGYVSPTKRDRNMGGEYPYAERDSRYIDRKYPYYMAERSDMGYQRYGEPFRPMEFDIYGGIMPRYVDSSCDGSYEEKEWEEHLENWCKDLKRYDKFGMSKDEIISQARQMGVEFRNFTEKEFLTTYYMLMSDYTMDMLNSPQAYMIMAKDFLNDDDSYLKGGDKLCAYYYEVVKGGKE